jgi:hypothetical protein
VAVNALHNCGKSYSQIFELLKPLKILWMFIYRAIKRYGELWRVEDRAQSGCLKSLRAQTAIKTERERICRNPLWKQFMSRELNTLTQSMSCLIRDDQHMRDKSTVTPPVARREWAWKHPLHGWENLHHRGAVQPPEQ